MRNTDGRNLKNVVQAGFRQDLSRGRPCKRRNCSLLFQVMHPGELFKVDRARVNMHAHVHVFISLSVCVCMYIYIYID